MAAVSSLLLSWCQRLGKSFIHFRPFWSLLTLVGNLIWTLLSWPVSFPQLAGEPADAYEQLLIYRDLVPGPLFRQTADLVGWSESTLRRRAEQWKWKERLASYDSDLLDQLSIEGRDESLERFQISLQLFREDQLQRAKRFKTLPRECWRWLNRASVSS